MDPADRPDCGNEKTDGKKRTRLKLIGMGIAAIIIILAIILVNYFGAPSTIAQSMFYKDHPGATIIHVTDEEMKSDSGLHRVVWISFNYSGKVFFAHGRNYDAIAYSFEFIDNQWVFIAQSME